VGADGFERVPARQYRLLLGRTHIGPDEAIEFVHRIPGLTDVILVLAAFRLTGLIETVAFHIEEPAVIAAADAFILDLAVIERRAAVRAAWIEQARPAFAIAEEDQILAEDADVLRHRSDFFGERDRMPIAAHEFAAGRARPDLGQFGIPGLLPAAIGVAGILIRISRHVDPPSLWVRILAQAVRPVSRWRAKMITGATQITMRLPSAAASAL